MFSIIFSQVVVGKEEVIAAALSMQKNATKQNDHVTSRYTLLVIARKYLTHINNRWAGIINRWATLNAQVLRIVRKHVNRRKRYIQCIKGVTLNWKRVFKSESCELVSRKCKQVYMTVEKYSLSFFQHIVSMNSTRLWSALNLKQVEAIARFLLVNVIVV